MLLKRKTIKLFMVSAVLSAMLLTVTGCSDSNKEPEKNNAVQPEPTNKIEQTETKEYTGDKIITLNGVIYYPENIAEYLHTEVAESDFSKVSFYAVIGEHKKTALFDISLYETEYTVNMYEPDVDNTWLDEEADILYALQESINEIVVDLSDVMMDIDIDTTYGTLKYPAKWEKYAIITVSGDTNCTVNVAANIEGEKVELFSVILGEETSDSIGTVKDKDGNEVFVTIIVNEIADKYTEDSDLLYSMQEDINVIMESLGFV